MRHVYRENDAFPAAWEDPQGLTHPVVATQNIAEEGRHYIVSVATCYPGRFVTQDEVVFNRPTACIFCAIRSPR